jgi:hypothetical protein
VKKVKVVPTAIRRFVRIVKKTKEEDNGSRHEAGRACVRLPGDHE